MLRLNKDATSLQHSNTSLMIIWLHRNYIRRVCITGWMLKCAHGAIDQRIILELVFSVLTRLSKLLKSSLSMEHTVTHCESQQMMNARFFRRLGHIIRNFNPSRVTFEGLNYLRKFGKRFVQTSFSKVVISTVIAFIVDCLLNTLHISKKFVWDQQKFSRKQTVTEEVRLYFP